MQKPQLDGRQRVVIETVSPEIDGGRFAAKRTVGDTVRVEADIFTDGHDSFAAVVRYWQAGSDKWQENPMQFVDNDRWAGTFSVTALGRARFTIIAWVDHWETWRRDLLKRISAHSDSNVDYLIGANLIESAAQRAGGADGRGGGDFTAGGKGPFNLAGRGDGIEFVIKGAEVDGAIRGDGG